MSKFKLFAFSIITISAAIEIKKKTFELELRTYSNKKITVRVDDDELGAGTFATVFKGEIIKIDKKIAKRRDFVALKFTKIGYSEGDEEEMEKENSKNVGNKNILKNNGGGDPYDRELLQRKEWDIVKAFDTLPEHKRRHVIGIRERGEYQQDETHKYLFTIMELGKMDFATYLWELREIWQRHGTKLDDDIILGQIEQVVLATREMHQKIMHLDLKPANLLFVLENGSQTPVLKGIDFGASQLILDKNGKKYKNSAKLANFCKRMDHNSPVTTDVYESREHKMQCTYFRGGEGGGHRMQLSTKSDIWAIGIMLHELVLMGSDEGITSRKILYNTLIWISEWYQQLTTVEQGWEHEVSSNLDQVFTITTYLFEIWTKFPRTFYLIVATLRKQPKQRPSANGIWSYLKNQCHFGKEAELLPELSLESFKNLLKNEKLRIEDALEDPKELLKNLGKIKKMRANLRKIKYLLELAEKMEVGGIKSEKNEICDTETTEIVETEPEKGSENWRKNKSEPKNGWQKDVMRMFGIK